MSAATADTTEERINSNIINLKPDYMSLLVGINDVWHELGGWHSGTTIGYKKIVKFDPVETDEIRICILNSRVALIISFVGIY